MPKIRKETELRVITSTKKLVDYVLTVTEKSPKKYRYTFVERIHTILFDLVECLYRANIEKLGNPKRQEYQKDALVCLQLLDYFCDIAVDEKCLIFRQYENISEMICTTTNLLNSWILSDLRRINEKK